MYQSGKCEMQAYVRIYWIPWIREIPLDECWCKKGKQEFCLFCIGSIIYDVIVTSGHLLTVCTATRMRSHFHFDGILAYSHHSNMASAWLWTRPVMAAVIRLPSLPSLGRGSVFAHFCAVYLPCTLTECHSCCILLYSSEYIILNHQYSLKNNMFKQ